jgi:hypothetical protein
LLRTCQQALPHQAFAEKIQSPAISTDLRLENVYYIDMKALPQGLRNGRYHLTLASNCILFLFTVQNNTGRYFNSFVFHLGTWHINE